MTTPPTDPQTPAPPADVTTPLTVPTETPITPVQAGERIATLDVLRGFAIFGILLVNIEIFRAPIYDFFLPPVPDPTTADAAARWLMYTFGATKFYLIFSLLFGIGMSVQLERVRQRNGTFTWLYLRRLFVLLLIGLAHATLLWFGDVLVSYALMGVLLLALRGVPRVWLVILAVLAYLVPIMLLGLVTLGVELLRVSPDHAAEMADNMQNAYAHYATLREAALHNYATGGFITVLEQRISDHLNGSISLVIGMLPSIVAAFLLGRVIWLRGILQHPEQHQPLLRWLSTWGLAIGVALGAAFGTMVLHYGMAEISPEMFSAQALLTVSAPFLSFGYMAVIVRLMQSPTWQRRLTPLAAVGRMALSNYILQTVICTTIFYGYGLGLFGKVGPAAGLGLVVLIYACQIPLSMLWLRRFRFGPLEWVWRTLTYMRWQPMLRTSQPPEATGTTP
jgi:uncharacterized protein